MVSPVAGRCRACETEGLTDRPARLRRLFSPSTRLPHFLFSKRFLEVPIILRLFIGDNEEMANKSIELIDNNPVLVLPEVLEEVTFVMTKFYGTRLC